MSLFAAVAGRLVASGIPCALVGAEALALRGASRATADRDLLTTDPRVLDAALWAPLAGFGARVEVRCGDADDPLAGVVRFEAEGERPVDLVVGRAAWQTRLLARAETLDLGELRIAVPPASDLVLLKLYAGGPQDAWDIAELLAGPEGELIAAQVELRLQELPQDAAQLWRRIRAG